VAFQQLYYTSCERGLAGVPGYQFNAVSPGVTPEVMREVERITGYEPPPELAYEDAARDAGAYPVSLCFSPGEPALLANVVFTGSDFSRRFGNYFAHALATAAPEADLGDRLPIETWGAAFWTSQLADSTSLPPLPGPPPGGRLRPGAVEEFLRGHPERSRLAALLTAVERAVARGERTVVLVSAEAGANAAWIAAASYLLPPALVRRTSFTTYHRRPAHSPFHLVGTVPGADLGSQPAHVFALFDFVRGRGSELEVHPLAELLASLGPVAAHDLWRQAVVLPTRGGASLDAWHAPLAAAAAAAGRRLSRAHLDAAVRWFAEQSDRLDPRQASTLAEALLGQAGADDRQVRAIIGAVHGARAGGLVEGLDGLEALLVRAQLERVAAGAGTGDDRPAVSPAAREGAARHCASLLASAEPPAALALLRWADAAGLELGRPAVTGAGARLARRLAREGPGADLREPLRAAVLGRQALREGLLEELARRVERDPRAASAVLAGRWDGLLALVDLAAQPGLEELRLLGEGRRHPERRIEVLGELLARPPGRRPARSLPLDELWPEGGWSVEEARWALPLFEEPGVDPGPAAAWLADALHRAPPPGDAEAWEGYRDLCGALAGSRLRPLLPEAAEPVLGRAEWLAAFRKAPASAEAAARQVDELAEAREGVEAGSPERALIEAALAEARRRRPWPARLRRRLRRLAGRPAGTPRGGSGSGR
jgi:GTPase-associated protein 1, N-terminal domain type 2/GTPase-associated protein 1, C-terminal domain/GTPase-associated protein 1, middle domain